MARRLLSIWFPRLASDASLKRRPIEGAFALTQRSGNTDHLHCVNRDALARGLRRGMSLVDARAVWPDLATRPADLAAEAQVLEALCRRAERYAPMVARDGEEGLRLMSRALHLFGGEEDLRGDLHAKLERAGLAVTSAIAGTRGDAYGLARHGGGIIADGGLVAGLGPLPVSALRIDHGTAEALVRMGLQRISDLLPLPRGPLARRFGQALVLRLDQAMGVQGEPVVAELPAPYFGVRMTLPDPVGLQSDVTAGLLRLLDWLCAQLAATHMGARRVRLELRRVDQGTAQVEIGLARPMRDASRIAALFAKGVDEIDAGFGIDALRLSAPVVEPLAPEQMSGAQISGDATARQDDAMADLISSLGNRIGFDRVLRLNAVEGLIPERSFLTVPAAYSTAQPGPRRRGPPLPVTLFAPEPVALLATPCPGHPPSRFRWLRIGFATLRVKGPERITPEWWFDDPNWRTGLRDYWRIETQEGSRLWLFHTLQSDGPSEQPWYAQGEFA